MRVGVLGTGRIGAPLAEALARRGHRVRVSARSERASGALAARWANVRVIADNEALVSQSDVLVVCLRAETAWEVLPGLPLRPDLHLVSVMADAPLARLRAAGPAASICSAIPLPFVARGRCPLPVHGDAGALEALFGQDAPLVPVVDEGSMAAYWAVAGALAGLLAEVDAVAGWLATQTGDAVGAERYVAALCAGQLGALETDGRGRLRGAIEQLSTEGGLSRQFRDHLAARETFAALGTGLDALLGRCAAGDRALVRRPGDPSPVARRSGLPGSKRSSG